MNNIYAVMVTYIDGAELLGIFNDYMLARQMIEDLKKYKINFGTEEDFIIYDFSDKLNKFIDYDDIEKLEVESIKGIH